MTGLFVLLSNLSNVPVTALLLLLIVMSVFLLVLTLKLAYHGFLSVGPIIKNSSRYYVVTLPEKDFKVLRFLFVVSMVVALFALIIISLFVERILI